MRKIQLALLTLVALATTPVEAMPNAPTVVVVVDVGPYALVSWMPGDVSGAERYNVFGFVGTQATYLGSTQAPLTSFLAPGGYEGYRVVSASGESVGLPCVYTNTNPPDVGYDLYCGRFAQNVQYAAPLP